MERVLGELPHVTKVHWDWQNQLGWVRFDGKGTPSERDLILAIEKRTMYSSGKVRWIEREEDLPDALR